MSARDAERGAVRLAATLLPALLLLLPACSDGDGDGTGLNCLTFAAAAPPASSTVAAAPGAGSSCETVQVELRISDVTDVFSVSFDALFDPAVASFQGVSTAGSLLEADGSTLEVLVLESPGQVAVGVTRQSSTGVDAGAAELLLVLEFSRVAPMGASMLTLEQPKVLGSETPPQEKPGILWTGGTLQVG